MKYNFNNKKINERIFNRVNGYLGFSCAILDIFFNKKEV